MQKLSRIKPAIDRVIAETPKWKCFCCHDTGLVIRLELVLDGFCDGSPPEYSAPSDYGMLCKACEAQYGLTHLGLDDRLTQAQCKEIHQARLNDWVETAKARAGYQDNPPVNNPVPEAIANPPTTRSAGKLTGIAAMFGAEKRTPPPAPEPEPEEKIFEYQGFCVGDVVVITLERFPADSQRNMRKTGECPHEGKVASIKGWQKNTAMGRASWEPVLDVEGEEWVGIVPWLKHLEVA